MYNDEFKLQYKKIPFATHTREYVGAEIAEDIVRLSHQHKEMEILVVLKGKAKIHIEEECFFAKAGDVVIIPPYGMHRATILKGTDFEHRCICFDLKMVYDRELSLGLENGEVTFSPYVIADEKLKKYAIAAYDAKIAGNSGWELCAVGNVSLFIGRLCELGVIVKNRVEKNDFCHRVYKYIDENYGEKITSKDAAEALFMNGSYFCRKFKNGFGYSFGDYLCMHRIEKAKTMLKNGCMSVSEIASGVGFGSFSYFSKIFKEQTGVTPSEYRKRLWQMP